MLECSTHAPLSHDGGRADAQSAVGRRRTPKLPALLALAALAALSIGPSAALPALEGEVALDTAPTVEIVDPAGDTVSISGSIELDARASDDVGVVRVAYFVDGTQVAIDETCCDWGEPWDSTSVADGEHVFVAKAWDAAGNVGTSSPVTATVNNLPDTSPPSSPGGANPLTCAGYAEQRVFLEAQSWWMQTPGQTGTDFGHLHVATCFPWAAELTGTVHFDVRVVMHQNPGVLRHVRLNIFETGVDVWSAQNLRCALDTCAWWFQFDVDTSQATKDGCQEFRIQAHVDEPDGNRALVTNGWRADLQNGKPEAPYCDFRGFNFTEGRGWYGIFDGVDFGYENGRLEDPLPLAPLTGVWTPKVKMIPGAGGIPTTHHSAHIDPDFHSGHAGTILEEGPGTFSGDLTIDTRQLADGRHRLVLRTDAETNIGSMLSGILVVPFTVANGETPPPPPPPVDTTPPSATLLQPSAGATLSGTATLDAEAADDVGVTRVDYLLNGATIAYDATCCAWDEQWDTKTVPDGTYSLVAKARDAAGNVGASEPVEVVVDNVPDAPACTIVGTSGNDVIYGTSGPDVICAGDGDDVVYAQGGDDVVYGGAGNDKLYGNAGDDVLVGGPGKDKLVGGPGDDRLYAEDASGSFTLGRILGRGTALQTGPDYLSGGGGNDLLFGSAFADRLFGGPGRDRIYGRGGDDVLVGGAGSDELYGGPGRDTLLGRDGQRDRLDGGPGRDRAERDKRLDRVRSVESRL